MAKSNQRRSMPPGGSARPESPRRSFRPSAPAPPEQRPPAGGGARPSAGPPRPLTPAPAASTSRFGWLALIGPQRLVIAVVGLVVLAAIGILIYGWYDSYLRPRTELALRVGDRSYTMEYFAKRYRAALDDPPPGVNLRNEAQTRLPQAIKQGIEKESIALQRADGIGVSVSSNEVDRTMVTRLGAAIVPEEGQPNGPNDPFTVTAQMEAAVRSQLRRFDMTLAQYRLLSEAQLLNQKIVQHFAEQAPARAPQVRVRLIQLPTESDARIATERIRSGQQTFSELADAVSLDAAGKGRGGERDWLPRGVLPPALDAIAFDAAKLPVNTLSEPIDSGLEAAWFVMEVLERSSDREVADDVRRQLGEKATEEWYQQQRESMTIVDALTPEKIAWAFNWARPPATAQRPGQPVPGGPGGAPISAPFQTQPFQPGAPGLPAGAQPPAPLPPGSEPGGPPPLPGSQPPPPPAGGQP